MQSLDSFQLFQLYQSGKNPEIDPTLVPFLADLRNAKGQSLLHVADNTQAVEFLLAANLDPNLADTEGRTPLMRFRSATTNRLLIQAGADVNLRDQNGDGALDYQSGSLVCCTGYCEPEYPPLEMLLESGAVPPSPERAQRWIDVARHQVTSALEKSQCQGFEDWVGTLQRRYPAG
jgi:hypothetical protein